jgi:hypothetical protein
VRRSPVSDSGEETVGEDSDDDESFAGRGTHNPADPEFKAGAIIIYLVQEGDEMLLGYVVTVHGDGKGVPPFYTAYLEGLGENRFKDSDCFLWLIKMISPPPVSSPVPSQSSSRTSQARKDKNKNKEYLKQMSKMAKIVQQQRLKNKKLKKLFSDSQRQALQLSEALSQQQKNPPADRWDKYFTSEVTGAYYAVARGRRFDSFGIYADVHKFLLEVNGVVGSLFKVRESYSEAHLYLKEHFIKEHPTPSTVAATDSPPLSPEVGSLSPPAPPGEKRSNIFKASMLDLGGRSMTGYQSKVREGKIFGYSV